MTKRIQRRRGSYFLFLSLALHNPHSLKRRRGGGRRRPTYLTLGRRGEESVRLVLNLRRIRRMSILSQGAS